MMFYCLLLFWSLILYFELEFSFQISLSHTHTHHVVMLNEQKINVSPNLRSSYETSLSHLIWNIACLHLSQELSDLLYKTNLDSSYAITASRKKVCSSNLFGEFFDK